MNSMSRNIVPKFLSGVSLTNLRPKSCRNESTLIDGNLISQNVLNSIRQDVARFVADFGRPPSFTAITAGYDPSSLSYVKIKKKAAEFTGIKCDIVKVESSHSDGDILRIIDDLNRSDDVDGILVQLPLFPHNNERIICDSVAHLKDIDGTSSTSLGNLCLNTDHFVPCTALAVHHILKKEIGLDYCGKHAVVIGRSKHVGLPIALLLHSSDRFGDIEGLNMTTTLTHRHTPHKTLVDLCSCADVIVSAVGVPDLVKGDMFKPGAIVLDVGITKTVDLKGKRVLKGDVAVSDLKDKALFFSTVPGGVGPVTVAMLMRNVVRSAQARLSSICEVAANNNTTPR